MSRPTGPVERFLFEPVSTASLAVVRIAFGIVMIAWAAAFAPDVFAFFSAEGTIPAQPGGQGWGLLAFFPGDGAVIGVYVALVASAVALTVGLGTRLAAVVLFVCLLSLIRRATPIYNSGDLVLLHFAFFMSFAPAGAALSVDRWWSSRDRFLEFPRRSPWALRLLQLQLSIIYFFSVWAKVRGTTWNDGTATSYALRLEHLERFPLPNAMLTEPVVVNVLTYATLAIELGVAILIWNKRARLWAALAGVALHLGIDYRLEVGFFSLAMFVLYLAFLEPAWVEERVGALRSRLARRSPEAHPAPADPLTTSAFGD